MPAITKPWDGEPLASMETWLCWQNLAGQPMIDPVEYVGWTKAQGLNHIRLFSWQREDYRPFWSSTTWWHRLDRYVRLTREAGIYLTPSLCQGCNHTGHSHDDMPDQEELDVAEEALSLYADQPHIIWEFGNELPLAAHDNGTVQMGIDILKQAGQPVLWAPGQNEGRALYPWGVSGAALQGWTSGVNMSQFGTAHIVDHVHDDLKTRKTETMIATIERAKAEGAVGFAGLGSWTNKAGHKFGLETWGNQPGLADWIRTPVIQAIVKQFLGDGPSVPPPPVPSPDDDAEARAMNDLLHYHHMRMPFWGYDANRPGDRAGFEERLNRLAKARGRW